LNKKDNFVRIKDIMKYLTKTTIPIMVWDKECHQMLFLEILIYEKKKKEIVNKIITMIHIQHHYFQKNWFYDPSKDYEFQIDGQIKLIVKEDIHPNTKDEHQYIIFIYVEWFQL